jgi:hypothetical protein
VVQRLTTALGRFDEDFQLFARLLLANIFVQQFGAQGAFQRFFLRGQALLGHNAALGCATYQLVGFNHVHCRDG